MKRRIGTWITIVILAIAVAAPAFAHHQPEVNNLRQRVANQRDRIVELESYVLDLNARICALETDPAPGCPS